MLLQSRGVEKRRMRDLRHLYSLAALANQRDLARLVTADRAVQLSLRRHRAVVIEIVAARNLNLWQGMDRSGRAFLPRLLLVIFLPTRLQSLYHLSKYMNAITI